MIQIKELGISNMFSYGDGVIFSVDDKVTQLVGINGHGKSSIPSALEEILYNKNSRGLKKSSIPNMYSGVSGYSGYVLLDVDGIPYKVSKTVNSTTKLVLTKDGEDISGHTTTQTYKAIEQLLGMDFTTFTKLVYQSIGSSLDFLNATDANRKKFLVTLLGLEKYVEAEKLLKEAAKEAKANVANAKTTVDTVSLWLESNSDIPDARHPEPVPAEPIDIRETLEELVIKDASIGETNKGIVANQQKRSVLRSLLNAPVPEVPKVDKECILEVSGTVQELKLLSAAKASELEVSKREYSKAESIRDRCHLCNSVLDVGNKLELMSSYATRIAELKLELDHINIDLIDAESSLSKLRLEDTKYETYVKYTERILAVEGEIDSTKPTEVLDREELMQQIVKLRKDITTRTKEIDRAVAVNHQIDLSNSKREHLIEQSENFRRQLRDAVHLLDSSMDLFMRTDILASALGSKGLIAYKIESMVKVFEKLINEYLQILADGNIAINFSVDDTKLSLNTYKGGKAIDIKSLSSGEFNRVNTATLLSVRKLMTSISKTDINILFLDEVVSVLDKEGKDTLVELLLKEPNINSVVVSHEYSHPLASVVKVYKENDISRLIYE